MSLGYMPDWISDGACDDLLFGGVHAAPDDIADFGAWSLGPATSDALGFKAEDQAAEREAILEEMRAAGLHRPGGFRRQAFSLSDLTALQPPSADSSVFDQSSSAGFDADAAMWPPLPADTCSMLPGPYSPSPQRDLLADTCFSTYPSLAPPAAGTLGTAFLNSPLGGGNSPLGDPLRFSNQTLGVHMSSEPMLGCIPENELLQPVMSGDLGRMDIAPSLLGTPSGASPAALTAAPGQQRAGDPPAQHAAPPKGLRPSRMRRSQSALELTSMPYRPSSHQAAPLPRPLGAADVELTTPEGHVYTAGRLSAEERLQKILKYRQKRHERNFSKRIKYQCRKTLADSRPRVRGRFARNDDSSAVLPASAQSASSTA